MPGRSRFTAVQLSNPGSKVFSPRRRPHSPEEERIKSSALRGKRFHYRYIAAELGWIATLLMPDNSEETASVLNDSGSWIKNLDPIQANRFYKALVRRCRKTELGARADTLRWFPPTDPRQ